MGTWRSNAVGLARLRHEVITLEIARYKSVCPALCGNSVDTPNSHAQVTRIESIIRKPCFMDVDGLPSKKASMDRWPAKSLQDIALTKTASRRRGYGHNPSCYSCLRERSDRGIGA